MQVRHTRYICRAVFDERPMRRHKMLGRHRPREGRWKRLRLKLSLAMSICSEGLIQDKMHRFGTISLQIPINS
jgi:hypothetical protein